MAKVVFLFDIEKYFHLFLYKMKIMFVIQANIQGAIFCLIFKAKHSLLKGAGKQCNIFEIYNVVYD